MQKVLHQPLFFCSVSGTIEEKTGGAKLKNRDYLIVMQQILQLIDEGVHVVDPDGNSVVYNRAMAMLEKMESQDVLKKLLTR